MSFTPRASFNRSRRPVRIWVDGCFDLMHYGHANALRQAKEMGDYLVVGVHSDAEVLKHKGPTVMNEEERYAAVAACKWVDEVVRDAPYVTSLEYLDKYECDYCLHGDDISTAEDGSDCYREIKEAGRYREFQRTQGVSTTELVGRMLLMTKHHHRRKRADSVSSLASVNTEDLNSFSTGSNPTDPQTSVSHFLPTSRRIVQFSEGKEPKPTDRVIYADGAFDLFHAGHVEFLRKAKEQGDYLLVGVHDDQTVNRVKGSNFPLMNLQERVLSVLACRYVDEVVIGAPYSINVDALNKVYHVTAVVHGKTPAEPDVDGRDPYEIPRQLGIYQELDHTLSGLTTTAIIDRIIEQRKLYEDRQRHKREKALLEAKLKVTTTTTTPSSTTSSSTATNSTSQP